MSTNVGEIDLNLVLNSTKFSSSLRNVNNIADTTANKLTNTLGTIATAVGLAFSITAVVKFGQECLKVANQTSNAWIGLNSILTGQGKSFEQAKNFINDYVADGLVPLNNAVTAYKNLTLRGYDSEQIQKTMNALKNSATFARQSTYSLGDAVSLATEGLKNENSVVVDNAGVTKNVAKMWEDYAKSIGKTVNSLTQAEKIQAEVNGILEETKFQSNDAAIYANTYSGKIAQLNTAFTNMKTAIGSVIQPIAKAFIPIITSAVNAVTKLFTSFSSLLALFGFKTDLEVAFDGISDLSDNADSAANSIAGIGNSASKTAKELKKTIAGFDEINKLEDTSNSSTGSGSGGGTGSSGTSVVSAVTSNNSTAETPAWIKNFDFSNLIKAFDNLKSAVSPIIDTVGEALKWFYDEILEPLAKWTIKDLLPAFLNALAGALRVLNPILKAFKKAAIWLWDSFLEPIAKWTGGAIVKILNGIGEALTNLGNSIDNSKTATSILEGLAKAVLALGTAYGIVKLEMKAGLAIQGLVVPIITAMTTAYKVATGQIILMGTSTQATSVLVSAFGIITQLLTGKITLATAATALWNVAQTAFNAVLAANPIGVTIVAVTALVAGIVALVSWTKKATEAEKEASNAAKERLEVTQQKYDAYKQFNEQQSNQLASDMVEINNAQRLVEELRLLTDEKGNVQDKDRIRAEFILGELNTALGTEYTMIGNQIQKYDELKISIDKAIESKKVQILLENEEAKYKEALINLTETETERSQAKLEMDEAIAAFEQKENKENAQRVLDSIERYNQLDEMSKTYNENIRIYETATAEMLKGNNEDAIQLLQNRKIALKSYESTLQLSSDDQNKILQEQYKKSVEDLDDYKDKYLKGVQGFTKDGLLEATQYAIDARTEYSKVGGETVEGYIDGITSEKQEMWKTLSEIFSGAISTTKEELDSHSPSKKFKTIGQDTIQGYIDGANGKQNSLSSAMKSLFNGAIATAKKVLDSHSPSVVFEGLGEDTTDGYINGLADNFKNVTNSVKDMFSNTNSIAEDNEIAFNTSPILNFISVIEKGISTFEDFKNSLIEISQIVKENFNISLPEISQSQFLRANTPKVAFANVSNTNRIGKDEILEVVKAVINNKGQNDSDENKDFDGDINIPIYIDSELVTRQQYKRKDILNLATNGRVGS